jgi:hypothetical protein
MSKPKISPLGTNVHPEKSKYQADPWEPSVNGKDGNEKKAGKDYTGVYGGTTKPDDGDDKDVPPELSGREPILRMSYTQAPDFIPAPRQKPKDGTSPAMEGGDFSIDLGSLRAAEQTCLDACSAVIDQYDQLKGEVDKAAADDNFFGQNVATTQYHPGPRPWVDPGEPYSQPDQYDDSSQKFADSIIPQMKNLLNAIGNATVAMGQFPALLNNTGQAYATMDNSAAFVDD